MSLGNRPGFVASLAARVQAAAADQLNHLVLAHDDAGRRARPELVHGCGSHLCKSHGEKIQQNTSAPRQARACLASEAEGSFARMTARMRLHTSVQ